MKKTFWTEVALAAVLLAVLTLPVSAQEEGFSVRLRRDFGYGAGVNVRGTLTISLVGDETQVESIAFLIDGEVMASVGDAPFRFQFHTDDYGFGRHQLNARVILQDGRVETTSVVGMNFISPEEERGSLVTLFFGIGGALILAVVIYLLVQTLIFKRKPKRAHQTEEARQYGLLGGTICPQCGRAYPRHIWGINLVIGKLDRCDHCGKWAMTVRASPERLRAAEEAEFKALEKDKGEGVIGYQIRDALDDSKYVDEV